MRNYQRKYDRIRNELSNSALPFQTKEGVIKRTAEVEQLGIKHITVYHNLVSSDTYISIYNE